MRVLGVLSFLLSAGALWAQHGYTLADIENGGRLYRGTCSVCHGPDGDFIPGIDFSHGKFRRATDDESIERIIINGIPNTGMPSNNLTEPQAENVVAYLRSLPSAGKAITSGGDAAKGKAIFEGKGGCRNCHRVRGVGSRMGPAPPGIRTLCRGAGVGEECSAP